MCLKAYICKIYLWPGAGEIVDWHLTDSEVYWADKNRLTTNCNRRQAVTNQQSKTSGEGTNLRMSARHYRKAWMVQGDTGDSIWKSPSSSWPRRGGWQIGSLCDGISFFRDPAVLGECYNVLGKDRFGRPSANSDTEPHINKFSSLSG